MDEGVGSGDTGGRPVSITEHSRPRVKLLACDQELGLRVPADQIARARSELLAPVRQLPVGTWDVPGEPADRARLGYLVVEGLLAREIVLAEHICAELLGEGDVLEPSSSMREETLLDYRVQWHVLRPVTVAVLDEEVWRELAQWPPVLSALLDRAIRRVQRMAVHQALLQLSPVETRLLVLFWYLAERWGRVTPSGIALRLRLSHEMLGHLVGVQRASVTTALSRIAPTGLVVRRSDGTWLLRGDPPEELAHIQWQDRATLAGHSA
jgi:CRP/FNR family transcriptional regulator, cyclic AMP receptor protein